MEATEVRKLPQLEDGHWWYRERRHLLAKAIAGLTPGRALDVGAAGGGNTRVLRDHGWQAVALEYGADGAEVAAGRGLPTLRSDATSLPLADDSLDLVVAFDLLEHLHDDDAAVAEVHRVLRPTGTYLVAVPAVPGSSTCSSGAVFESTRCSRGTSCSVPSSRCGAGPARAPTSMHCTPSSTSGCARSSRPSATCRSRTCPESACSCEPARSTDRTRRRYVAAAQRRGAAGERPGSGRGAAGERHGTGPGASGTGGA